MRASRSGSRSPAPGPTGPGRRKMTIVPQHCAGSWAISRMGRTGGRLKRAMAARDAGSATIRPPGTTAVALAHQRLGPLRPHLEGVRHLIVLPSQALAGIPIEALVAALPAGAPHRGQLCPLGVDVRPSVHRTPNRQVRPGCWPWAIRPSPSRPRAPGADAARSRHRDPGRRTQRHRRPLRASRPATCCWSTTARSCGPSTT